MATVTLKGQEIRTSGELPAVGSKAPDFTLTKNDLSDATYSEFEGKNIVLNIFLSLDTSTCARSVRKFNEMAASLKDTVVLCVSEDLPFAQKRFCGVEEIENAITLSAFRYRAFANNYGVRILYGSMKSLMARSVIIINKMGRVIYTEQVPEISQEPDYEAALEALGG
ncbi:MAG: thiol peroxidase [bacterium]|nr:thiol peroxidase [bacterium]MDT8365881.1 thiol peroxidase [bacterium]